MPGLESVNLRAIKLFIAVYDAQNFSAVARREGISASQVSRVIHQLEDSLGQQLFYRNTRAIAPTESGRLFIDYARGITGNMEEARRTLHERTLAPSGLVRINAPIYFGQRHVAPGLAALAERYPQLTIEMMQTDDYIDPHKEPADVIFRIGALTDSSFHARVFGTQYYYLAASPEYVRKHGALVHPDELHRHRCLVYRGSSGPNRWFFRQPGREWIHYPVSPLLASNHAETLLVAALGGMGLLLYPDWLIGDRLQTGELVRLLPDFAAAITTEPQHIAAIYPHTRHPPLNVRAIIDHFVEAFGSPLYWQIQPGTSSRL